MELTPLGGGSPSRAVGMERAELAVDKVGRGVLCHGGEDAVVGCLELEYAPGDDIELTPGLGVELTGRFLVGEQPLGGRLALSPLGLTAPMRFTMPLARDQDGLVRMLEIGEDGVFRTPRLSRGIYLIEAELVNGSVYRSEPIDVPSAEELLEQLDAEALPVLDLGDLLIEQGASVDFYVVDSEGLPVEGAIVGISQVSKAGDIKELKAHSDPEGRARLYGVALELPGQSVCFKQSYLSDRRAFDIAPPLVECLLERLASIVGRSVNGDGEAVPGASVQLKDQSSGARPRLSTADTDGDFAFDDVPAGAYLLTMAAAGFAIERLEIELEPGEPRDLEELALRPGRALSGVVLERATLEPVEGAEALVVSPPGAGSSDTDAEGLFRLQTDFEEPIMLRISSARHATQHVEVGPDQLDAEQPLEVLLSAGGRIEAIVLDSASGLPCEGCRVSFGNAGSEMTNRDGTARSGILDVGTYAVSLASTQSRGTLMTVRSSPEVKIARVREKQTTVVVFGEESGDLEITFDQPLGPDWELSSRGAGSVATWPWQDGVVRISRRAGEALEVFLERPGRASLQVWIATVEADFDGRRLELTLPRTRVSGRLMEADRSPAGGVVELKSAANPRASATVVLSDDGSFQMPFLRSGQYQLVLNGQGLRAVILSEGANDLGDIVLGSP